MLHTEGAVGTASLLGEGRRQVSFRPQTTKSTRFNMPAKQASANQRNSARRRRAKRLRPVPHLSVVPSAKNIIMTFTSAFTVNEAAAGTGGVWFLRLNSVYDPDATGVGASAIGYSTWSGLFINYKVKRVTARVSGNYSGNNGGMGRLTLVPVPFQSVLPANAGTWPLLRQARSVVVGDQANGGKTVANFNVTYDLADIAGITKQQYAVDMDWSGQTGSNPARQLYLGLCLQSIGSAVVGRAFFTVMLSFDVEWFNPTPMQ